MHLKGYVNSCAVVFCPQFVELAERQIAVVIFAENLNGSFFGIGAADVDAGFDSNVGVPVGFLSCVAQDAGEQSYRWFEDRLPALVINTCLDTGTLEVGIGVDNV